MDSVIVFDHPSVQYKVSILRNEVTETNEFRALIEEIAMLMDRKALRDLPLEDVEMETPIEACVALMVAGHKLAVVPILRAGSGMVNGILALVPSARTDHIGLYRDEVTYESHEYYYKFPNPIEEHATTAMDPMLVTGGSGISVADFIKERGGREIRSMAIIATPKGPKCLYDVYPDVQVYVGHLDRCLSEDAYIYPGPGDAGDRIFGTE